MNEKEKAAQEELSNALEELKSDSVGSKAEPAPRASNRPARSDNRGNRHDGRDQRPEMNSCPVDGNLKLVEREAYEYEEGKKTGKKILVRNLMCKACSDRYNAEKQVSAKGNASKALEAVLAGKEVKANEFPNRFGWVLAQIDIGRFEVEQEEAEVAYKKVYGERVLAPLEALGFVDDFEWSGENKTRSRIRYTPDAFHSGSGQETEKDLRGREEVRSAFASMRKMQGRLERAPEVKAELEAKLVEQARRAEETEKTATVDADTDTAAKDTTESEANES